MTLIATAALPLAMGGATHNSGLVGHWSFDEGTGTTTADDSGHTRDGTLAGGPAWSADTKHGSGYSLDFGDGATVTNPYVHADGIGVVDASTGLTATAWVKRTALQSSHGNVVRQGHYADRNFGLDVGNPGLNRIRAFVGFTDGTFLAVQPSAAILTQDEWVHLTMAYGGGQLRLFVNGVQAGSASYTKTPRTNELSIRIGGQPASEDGGALRFRGLIGDVRIFDRALTPAEIQNVMAATGPQITITAPAQGAEFEIDAEVAAAFACVDDLDPSPACIGTVADGSDIDTATTGQKSFTVNAQDNVGNRSTLTHTYTVVQSSCVNSLDGGIRPPVSVNGNGHFKAGSTIPVKIRVTCDEHQAGLVPTVSLTRISDEAEATVRSQANDGVTMRWSPSTTTEGGQYIYNLSTRLSTIGGKTVPAGTYILRVHIGETSESATITLR